MKAYSGNRMFWASALSYKIILLKYNNLLMFVCCSVYRYIQRYILRCQYEGGYNGDVNVPFKRG